MEKLLTSVNPLQPLILIGDMNINLLANSEPSTQAYLQLIDSFGYKQIVNSPTRTSNLTSSLIDHIIIKKDLLQLLKLHGTIDASFSDHDLIFLELARSSPHSFKQHHEQITIRCNKSFSETNFLNELSQVTWEADVSLSPDILWNDFLLKYTTILDKHAPRKTVKVKKLFKRNLG